MLPIPWKIEGPMLLGAELKIGASIAVLLLLDGEGGQPTLNLVLSSAPNQPFDEMVTFEVATEIHEDDLPQEWWLSSPDDLTEHFADQILMVVVLLDRNQVGGDLMRVSITTSHDGYSAEFKFGKWVGEVFTLSPL